MAGVRNETVKGVTVVVLLAIFAGLGWYLRGQSCENETDSVVSEHLAD